MRLALILLIVLGFSQALAEGLGENVYPKCFKALDKRIQTYCNCEIVENTSLILTGVGGLRAQVQIDKTVDGLPDVAWVLNQVNKSGHPGRLKTYVEGKSELKTWVIEEHIRKWDLEPGKNGLSMSKPVRIKRRYSFSVSKGSCDLQMAQVELKTRKQKAELEVTKKYCEDYRNGKRPASLETFHSDIQKECEAYMALDSAL